MSAPSTNAPAAATPASAPAPASAVPAAPLPAPQTLVQAAKLAIQLDRAIQLDYYVDTATNKAFLGEDDEAKEKMLVKSGDEFTSLIQKIYKVGDDFIILTENSIYIVSGKIQKRRIKSPQMRNGGEI
jgi:3-oxoacyl-ACP reductase-like protein